MNLKKKQKQKQKQKKRINISVGFVNDTYGVVFTQLIECQYLSQKYNIPIIVPTANTPSAVNQRELVGLFRNVTGIGVVDGVVVFSFSKTKRLCFFI